MPYDRDFAPSAILLRDVFLALLRGVEGRLAAPPAEGGSLAQPRAAKLALPDTEVRGGTWWC